MQAKNYKALAVSRLKSGATVHQPYMFSPGPVRLESPAVEVMTDLRLVAAATIDGDMQLDRANQMMIARGVRSLIVIDNRGEIAGLITARDIHGERPLRAVGGRGMTHEEVLVKDVMTPREDVEVLDMGDVLRAQVGNILETLRQSGRQHALVVDVDGLTGRQMARGIFSVSQIARQLGVPIHQTEVARTFAEIEAAIA